ncbi:SpoIIE family protein phosphatase [Streptomyces sp. NPDC086787]|uniref:SpoIIE family protein phosphatase n=1 Tax=Streptomyces sp. NPDC086787 TaxID=3365759 RepID=UPI00381CE60E
MDGSGKQAGQGRGTSSRALSALLVDASTRALSAADGRVGGVYLRSATPGMLRLAVLAGLPGPLFRPWWRLHVNRPFPVADAYRQGVPVVLSNAAEMMRRYPQFAAGLPFQFGSVYVPVPGERAPYGVLTVLRPAAPDAVDEVPGRDLLTRVAEELGDRMRALAEGDEGAVVWDADPVCVRPPACHPAVRRMGRFTWDPASSAVIADDRLHDLLGVRPGDLAGTAQGLADAVAPADAHRLLGALHDAAAGRAPSAPLHVRAGDGTPCLLELWPPVDSTCRVSGIILDMGPARADGAADLLPQGVFCLDRTGVIVYANAAAARLLDPEHTGLLGRPLSEAVPWLNQPSYEDHLRGALLSPEPVQFHARPAADKATEWLALSLHPGPDTVACTVVPVSRVDRPVGPAPAAPDTAAEPTAGGRIPVGPSIAPLYRPIALAIALTDAVTARQVSAVVTQELLPAFDGRRLAIYLLQDRHFYLAWETGFPQGFLAPFDGVGLDAHLPGVETLTTGRALFFESMQQMSAAYPGMPVDAIEGARVFLPLIASGRPVGSCILGFDHSRGFGTDERALLTALGGLIAHAMEKAQRYDSEAALARGLQQALLPRRLSSHPLVETAGRYLPGTQGMDVGGDWYDVVEAGDGLALVIGDVQGHGVQAAATMGQLRSAVRAFALGDRTPDEVMSGTNRLLIDLDPGQFASCCYVRLDPVTGLARVARAGHLPPLLRSPDGHTRVVQIPGGVVLGVDPHAEYPVARLRLEPGAVLALYTDGLVERPGTDIDDGIAALSVALEQAGPVAAGPGGRSLAGVADRLTAMARHTAERPDDMALLLAARREAAERRY